MARKTFKIAAFVEQANRMLRSKGTTVEGRMAIGALVSVTLMDAGVYAGFRALPQRDVPEGELPGVRYSDDGKLLPFPARFENTDSSRVEYFYKESARG